MLSNWRKRRADMKLWRQARTLEELAGLMARWVDGELSMWPGYRDGADQETVEIAPTLARLNRAGFLTDQSQPGFDGIGFDGLRWQQRAAVSGLVADELLMSRIRKAGEAAGVIVLIAHPWLLPQGQGCTATIRGGEPYTQFGAYLPPRILRQIWAGVSRDSMKEIADAWQVTVIDPDLGPDTQVWAALDSAIGAADESREAA